MLNDLLQGKKVILASKSPRRQELLKGLDIDFEVRTKDTNESFPDDMQAIKVSEYLAQKKADAFKGEIAPNELLITADTVVIIDGTILNKPTSKIRALDMLSRLSNKTHQVVTGVCLASQNKTTSFHTITEVTFKELSCDEMNYYIKKYQPFDKAGSYGIQEWIGYIGVTAIKGSYFNVVGLPVHALYDEIRSFYA